MKRSFLVTAALVAVFAICATTASAQTTFINDDFSTAAGNVSPNWSILDTGVNPSINPGGGADGGWRFDDPGFRAPNAPIVTPWAAADSDYRGPGNAPYTTELVSTVQDVSGAGQVLVEYDYHLRQISEICTVEVYDGSLWNIVSTAVANFGLAPDVTHDQFDVTALMGGATNGRLKFKYNSNAWDWYWLIDNVMMYEPAPVDVGTTALQAPILNTNSCFHNLTAAETLVIDYVNFGSTPLNPGDLINITVALDSVVVLAEVDSPLVPVAPGATVTYTTLGTVDLSAMGSHTLDITCTIAGDANTANDLLSISYTSPSQATKNFGYVENFDSLPSNNGIFTPTIFDVPADWVNAQDDAASLAGGTAVDWAPNSGTTGSSGGTVGPNGDHTQGPGSPGIYMFLEDSYENPDIELRSPCLDTSGAVGVPTVSFWHHSIPAAGAPGDNILEVDVIDETSGGTVTMSVASLPGNGTAGWFQVQVDLSAFAPNLIRVQFRGNTANANFQDDVAIDDFSFFDSIVPIGQAPQPGNAVFDVNNATNSQGLNVASGANGPYAADMQAGGTMNMTWSGQPNGIVICLFGPPNDAIASYPGVGQLDIGALPLVGGVPSLLFVFGDGSSLFPAGPLINSFFFTGPAGNGGVNFQVPAFIPGFFARFQCVMNPAGMFYISNAVDVSVVP